VAEFPIGIQPEAFDDLLHESEVRATISILEQQLKGMKVIVGVDRMDYIKGIPEKLRAFDKFLSDYPQREEKVKLIQVAIPSRQDCAEYQKLVDEVNSLVSEINGKHSMYSSHHTSMTLSTHKLLRNAQTHRLQGRCVNKDDQARSPTPQSALSTIPSPRGTYQLYTPCQIFASSPRFATA
jgi:trehalose-6-phosphate synthase